MHMLMCLMLSHKSHRLCLLFFFFFFGFVLGVFLLLRLDNFDCTTFKFAVSVFCLFSHIIELLCLIFILVTVFFSSRSCSLLLFLSLHCYSYFVHSLLTSFTFLLYVCFLFALWASLRKFFWNLCLVSLMSRFFRDSFCQFIFVHLWAMLSVLCIFCDFFCCWQLDIWIS